MIDVHAHLLPGVDDGPQTWEEAVEMARQAASQGITDMIATPHHLDGRYDNPAQSVELQVLDLNRRLQEEKIPVHLHAGQEIRIAGRFFEELEAGRLLALGSSQYMLLELPVVFDFDQVINLLYELRINGITPVIAHPERNPVLIRAPERMADFAGQGALGQATTHSFSGKFGSSVRRCAYRMCIDGLIQFVGSDAHDTHRRCIDLKDALELIRKDISPSFAKQLEENAERILRKEPVETIGKGRPVRKIWFFQK